LFSISFQNSKQYILKNIQQQEFSTSYLNIVDLGETNKSKIHRQLGHSLENDGFFFLVNHGLSREHMNQLFSSSRAFFDLPLDDKLSVRNEQTNRGFIPFQSETLDPKKSTEPDLNEGFYIATDIPNDSPLANLPLHSPNIYPSQSLLANFKSTLIQHQQECVRISLALLKEIALVMDQNENFFQPFFQDAMTFLKLMHYLPVTPKYQSSDRSVLSAGEHTDYGCITLLATEDIRGLEIFSHQKQQWQRVEEKPDPTALVCNIGDCLEVWSGHRFKSTLHRVVMDEKDQNTHRYSAPFFFDPSFNAEIQPLNQRSNPTKKIHFGTYLLEKYKQTYGIDF